MALPIRRDKSDAGPTRRRVPDTGKRLTKFPQLRDAWVDLQIEELDRAFKRAMEFIDVENKEFRLEAREIVALVRFRRKQYADSLRFLEEVALASKDASRWFSLAIAFTLAGKIAQGRTAFAKAVELQKESGYVCLPPLLSMRYQYAWALSEQKQYGLALDQIEPIKEAYEQLHGTDATFLYVRRVPMFDNTVELAFRILRGLGDRDNGRAWIRSLSGKVDEDGKRYLARCLQRFETDTQ